MIFPVRFLREMSMEKCMLLIVKLFLIVVVALMYYFSTLALINTKIKN